MTNREWLNTLSDEELTRVFYVDEGERVDMIDWLKEEREPIKLIEKAYELWTNAGYKVDFSITDKHRKGRWAIFTLNDNQSIAVSWFGDFNNEPHLHKQMELFNKTAEIMGWV